MSSAAVTPTPAEEDRTICFCHCVALSRIREAIAAGADTIEKIQNETCASTGCGGCEWEVSEVLKEELEKRK